MRNIPLLLGVALTVYTMMWLFSRHHTYVRHASSIEVRL